MYKILSQKIIFLTLFATKSTPRCDYNVFVETYRHRRDDLERVIYADVLFLIDFSMDVVTIWLTGNFMHVKTTARKVTVAAIVGAAVSVLLTVTSQGRFITAVSGIITAFIMCRVAFGVRGIKALKHTCALWSIALLLGGAMSYLTSESGVVGETSVNSVDNGGERLLPIAVLLCAALIFAVGRVSYKKTVNVEITLSDVKVKLMGLVDSGNLLCDPISGCPVILITASSAEKLLSISDIERIQHGRTEELDGTLRTRFRTVFAKGATGETMLPCFRADEILIGSRPCRAIIGISANGKFTDGLDCIVPSSLV